MVTIHLHLLKPYALFSSAAEIREIERIKATKNHFERSFNSDRRDMDCVGGNIFVGKRIIFIFKDNKIEKSLRANKILDTHTEVEVKRCLEKSFRVVTSKKKKGRSLRATTSFSSMRWVRHTCWSSGADDNNRCSFMSEGEPASPDDARLGRETPGIYDIYVQYVCPRAIFKGGGQGGLHVKKFTTIGNVVFLKNV